MTELKKSNPKNKVVVFKNCVNPPSKATLLKMLEEEAESADLDLGIDKSHLPERKWMLIALSTLNPNHEIFKKNYVPKLHEKTFDEL